MVIKGKLTTEHLQALLKNYITTSDKFKSSINNLSVAAAAMFLCILFIVKPTFQLIPISIYFTSAILFALLVTLIIQKVLIRKLNIKNLPNESESFTLHITEKGIHEKRETGNMLLQWEDVERISSDERTFFLYYSNGPIIIIPKETNMSEIQLKDMLSTYVDPSKIEPVSKVETKRLIKRAMIFSLIAALVLLCVIQFVFVKPQDEIEIAIKEVNALFVDADVTKDWEIDEQTTYTIKDTTDRKQIERAIQAVEKIEPADITEENYMLIFGLKMSILEAQEQLDKREEGE